MCVCVEGGLHCIGNQRWLCVMLINLKLNKKSNKEGRNILEG